MHDRLDRTGAKDGAGGADRSESSRTSRMFPFRMFPF